MAVCRRRASRHSRDGTDSADDADEAGSLLAARSRQAQCILSHDAQARAQGRVNRHSASTSIISTSNVRAAFTNFLEACLRAAYCSDHFPGNL
jgi:hypothetical protein